MIDFEKTKQEAEAFAKLSVEQYYREVLAAELDNLKMTYFGQKKPLKDVIPSFKVALVRLINSARDIFNDIDDNMDGGSKISFAEKAAEHEPIMAAKHVTNETIKELLSQGLSQKEIADKTGMTPNAVSHRLAYIKNREYKEKGIEKPASKPKCYSKELISDEELEEMYFKQGMTVRDISKKYGIIPDGLYKRTEALKAKRIEVAKECVSSQ